MKVAGGTGFAKLWAAQGISNLGDGVYGTALPLLAATLTRDPLLVSLVSFAEWLPWLLGLDAVGFGLLLGGSAVGGVLGSLIAARVVRVVIPARIAIWTMVGSALGFLVFALSSDPWLAGAMFGLVGFLRSPFVVAGVVIPVVALACLPAINTRTVAEARAAAGLEPGPGPP
jgi:MFS family permease